MIFKPVLALFLACAIQVCAQSGNEWPIPHNIGHTGFSPTTVLKPPLKVKWCTLVANLISGESGNGPVVAGGKVVIQGHNQHLVCLDAETGELLWRTSIPQAEYPYKWHFFPCIAQGKVYAVFSVRGDTAANGIRCFDLNTGDLVWKKDAGIISTFRMKDSPQYSNGRIYLHSLRDVNQSTVAQNNFNFKSQVQAWDAATGDTLWTYTVWDNIPNGTTSNPGEVNPALCVAGDTIFASCGAKDAGGRTVALRPDGSLIWEGTAYHVDNYTGNIQYTGDKLLVLSAYSGSSTIRALNPVNGAHIYTSGAGSSYSKISALMNGKGWNRGYGAAPRSFNLATGASSVACRLIPGDAYNSGCSAPRTANGYIYSGFGGAVGQNDFSKLYAWDDTGNPAWWMPTTPEAVAAGMDGHVCQDVAIAYDKMYWITNMSGEVFCFESDTRTASSIQAIWQPDTLEQYWFGQVRAVVSFTDGSSDTTVTACRFTNLDTNQCLLRTEGAVYATAPGTALIRVERYGLADTAGIPIAPSKSILDTPIFVRRINFQASWKPFEYGWLVDNGGGYTAAKGYGWVQPADLQVAREDRRGNFLLRSFVLTANGGTTVTQYKIDAPDGDYIIRLAMGDNAWGGSTYCFTAYGSDTLCTISRTGNETATDTISVTGGNGITLTVAGFINYIVLVSANAGSQFCTLVDDEYGCPGSVQGPPVEAPSAVRALEVSPNPFNPEVRIRFALLEKGRVTLKIYDIDGKPVRTLASGECSAGHRVFSWNGRDNAGRPLSSGIYLVRLTANGHETVAKIQLLK
jgi:outer membrane protein assembly factor BamB